jgi:hypothetical protein
MAKYVSNPTRDSFVKVRDFICNNFVRESGSYIIHINDNYHLEFNMDGSFIFKYYGLEALIGLKSTTITLPNHIDVSKFVAKRFIADLWKDAKRALKEPKELDVQAEITIKLNKILSPEELVEKFSDIGLVEKISLTSAERNDSMVAKLFNPFLRTPFN